jgi:hypothetical protein
MTLAKSLAASCAWLLLSAAAPPVIFTPLEPRFSETADQYRQLWARDGDRIVAALERESGLVFPAHPIEIILHDARPITADRCLGIRLRGGRWGGYAKGTLVHELGHCLAAALPRDAGLDDHRLLYLFLYDAWVDLYGTAYADRMVAIERRIPGGYDYSAAWTWALSMTREERQAWLQALRD